MQSAPAVAARATIMLACIIVVPAVALVWDRWPEALELVCAGRMTELVELVRQQSARGANACQGPVCSSAPPAGPSAAPQPATALPPGHGQATAALEMTPSPLGPIADSAATMVAPAASSVAPALYQAPSDAAPLVAPPAPIDPSTQFAGANGVTASQALPAHFVGPPVLRDAGNSSTAESSAANPFLALEERLRALGATYYLLESWGSEGNLYRFHAKMALAGNANHTRQFEATDVDPLRAMRRVLDEVEAWRSGRSAY